MMDILVTKRDGRQERLDLEKIHRVVIWASEGLHSVSLDSSDPPSGALNYLKIVSFFAIVLCCQNIFTIRRFSHWNGKLDGFINKLLRSGGRGIRSPPIVIV